jgi:hypothetical protein
MDTTIRFRAHIGNAMNAILTLRRTICVKTRLGGKGKY